MKKIFLSTVLVLLLLPKAHAEIGINAGIGIPFVSQYGLNVTLGDSWSIALGYNNLTLDSGSAKVSLTMPEVILNWHPFKGAFFIGVGAGQETLVAEANDSTTNSSIKAEVTASTMIAKLGWMWGKANGGFWFGMDISYISPSGGDPDITTSGAYSAEDLADVQEAGEKFGETAYTNITFAKFGYLF